MPFGTVTEGVCADVVRRDITNAQGYICPTENQAVYNADHPHQEPPVKPKPRPQVLREKQTPPPPKPKDENLKRARQLYSALCCIAGMMDVTIVDIALKCKGDPYRYHTVGEKRVIERDKP